MRPVVVPNNPPPNTYDEAAQLAVPVYQGHDPVMQARWNNKTKTDLLNDLSALIDPWATAGAELTPQGTPSFDDATEQDDYDWYMGLLTAGDHDWGDARRALIGVLGQYCSYCGSPVFSHLHIEHVRPKSSFPDGIFAWSNFLLACASCNSAKSNRPNQGNVWGGPMTTANATAYITNQNSINYLWPFFDWNRLGNAPIYPFRFRLKWIEYYRNQATFGNEITDAALLREMMQAFRSGTLPHERGLYYWPEGRAKYFFGVGVEALLTNLVWAADSIIEFASLNKIVPSNDSSKSVDRRIMNRTAAWFRALILRERLSLALSENDDDLAAAAVAMARVTIKNTGFWPIWLQVLGNTYIGGQSTQSFLQAVFPGTAQLIWRLPI